MSEPTDQPEDDGALRFAQRELLAALDALPQVQRWEIDDTMLQAMEKVLARSGRRRRPGNRRPRRQ
jgi:hypothetical protein